MAANENGTPPILYCAKLSPRAFIPRRSTPLSAGLDLYSAYEYIIPAHDRVLIWTDIQVFIPEGCYGRIAPRSGLALSHFLHVGGGVVDQDYRGNIGVVLFNFENIAYQVDPGDRIAQLILERNILPIVVETSRLSTTLRNTDGFGSTGKK